MKYYFFIAGCFLALLLFVNSNQNVQSYLNEPQTTINKMVAIVELATIYSVATISTATYGVIVTIGKEKEENKKNSQVLIVNQWA